LRKAGAALGDVDLFAAAVGPGSFTGLRIGLATIKAFAVHLRREVVGVPSLAALAHASRASGNIIALLPAGRGEVFAQQYHVRNGTVSPIDEPQHLSPEVVIERYSAIPDLHWVGEGTRMLERAGREFVSGTGDANQLELAPSVAVLAGRAFREGKTASPEDLQAVYVRASDAEINERWQQQKLQQPKLQKQPPN
jgi:tRNA threonylcarbamoyladenosine biosynthesis protein TsaB